MRKILAVLAIALTFAGFDAGAQGFPSQPVRIIIPVGPGGGFDFLGRIVAPTLSERLGQPVVVENRPGAGNLIGTAAVAKAPHDGYTLLVGGVTNITAYAGGIDFKPVSIPVIYPFCLLTRKDLPQSSLKEVIEFSRANPGKLTYASTGLATLQHVSGAMLAYLNGVTMLHIPYKGAGAAQQDLLAGRVDLFFNNCGVIKQFVDSGQLKLMALSGRERSSAFPDVPTIAETGVVPHEIESWLGFFAGARTPQPVVVRLRAELAAVVASPDVADRLVRDGGRLLRMSPEESEAFVQAEVAKWRSMLLNAGVTAE